MGKLDFTSFEEYQNEYAKSINNPEAFWEEKANNFTWRKKWNNILSWDFNKPEIKWFKGGKLNITENCLDRHLEKRGEQIAIKWIANEPSEQSICNSSFMLVICIGLLFIFQLFNKFFFGVRCKLRCHILKY